MTGRRPVRLAVVAVVLLAGCTTTTEGHPVATFTYEQATARVEHAVTDAVRVLTPTPQLELIGDTDVPCVPPGADGSQFNGQVQIGRVYFVAGLPSGHGKPELVTALTTHWTSQGYQITTDERPQNQAVTVVEPTTHFGMSVSVNAHGDLGLTATSPCVNPR